MANLANRPRICSNRVPIRTNPGTIGKIRQTAACESLLLLQKCNESPRSVIVARSTFLRKYFSKSSVPHIFDHHFWPSFLAVTILTNFCMPRGPRFGGAAGRGPPRHAKIDQFFFLLAWNFHENILEAKASRKPCENLAKTL